MDKKNQALMVVLSFLLALAAAAPLQELVEAAGRQLWLTDQGHVRYYEDSGSGQNYALVQSPASLAETYTLTWPVDDGDSGEFMKTDGSGALSWAVGTANLDSAYNASGAITIDTGSVALTGTQDVSFLSLDQNNVSATASVLKIDQAGSGGDALSVTTGGVDFAGTLDVAGTSTLAGNVSLGAITSALVTSNEGGKDTLSLSSTGTDTGITLGGDVALFRNAANELQLDDDLFIKGGKPWVDVRAYGATGDGSTDDTTAIQAAIDAASVIFFPAGIYKLTSELALDNDAGSNGDNKFLFGAARGGVAELVQSVAGQAVIRLDATGDDAGKIEIRNLSMKLGPSAVSQGIELQNCFEFSIINCHIYGTTGSDTDGGVGIHLSTTCKQGEIRGNYIGASLAAGIYISSGQSIQINDNQIFETYGHGIEITGSGNISVTDNQVLSNNDIGIYYVDNDTSYSQTNSHVVSGNICRNNGQAISPVAETASAGIDIRTTRATVTGNTCISNYGAGIQLKDARDCVVVGNVCEANGLASTGSNAGIHINGTGSGVTHCVVVGNRCTDESSGNTQVEGIVSDGGTLGPNIYANNIVEGNSGTQLSISSIDISSVYGNMDSSTPSDTVEFESDILVNERLLLGNTSELTCDSGGIITVTGSRHTVDTFGEVGADDLVTINGGVTGQLLILSSENTARIVTIKDGSNLKLQSHLPLDDPNDTITLIYDGTNWLEVAFTNNDT